MDVARRALLVNKEAVASPKENTSDILIIRAPIAWTDKIDDSRYARVMMDASMIPVLGGAIFSCEIRGKCSITRELRDVDLDIEYVKHGD